MLLIDASGLVLGRLASLCAKRALEGEQIVVVNAEKAVVTGNKEDLLWRFKTRFDLSAKGNPRKGPKASRMPDKILRDAVRGMLPKKRRGIQAIRRVRVFIGLPREFEGKGFVDLPGLTVDESKNFMLVGEISRLLGARW